MDNVIFILPFIFCVAKETLDDFARFDFNF